jgi:integrase
MNALTRKAIASLFKWLTRQSDRRGELMVKLAYTYALRASELVSLKLTDINLNLEGEGTITVRALKGGIDTHYHIPDELFFRLKNWTATVPAGSIYLFPGKRPGTHLSRQIFNSFFRHACFCSGRLKPDNPHILRHSRLSHLAEGFKGDGYRIIKAGRYDLQYISRHRDSKSLDKYIHLTEDTKRNLVNSK